MTSTHDPLPCRCEDHCSTAAPCTPAPVERRVSGVLGATGLAVAACAACCTVPFLAPVLSSLLGGGALVALERSHPALAGLGLVALAALVFTFVSRRRARRAGC